MKAVVNPNWKKLSDSLPDLISYADKLSYGPWKHYHDLEDLLNHINFTSDPTQLPTGVVVSYQALAARNLNPSDVVNIIDLSSKIAYSRLGQSFKEITYTGTTSKQIDYDYYEKLSSAGFRGCCLSPFTYGLEAALETTPSAYVNDNWHNMVIKRLNKNHNEFNKLKINLTYRQQQIADLIARRGLTNQQIAKQLGLSDSTIKMHIGLILKKYGVRHRTQLILAMQEKK